MSSLSLTIQSYQADPSFYLLTLPSTFSPTWSNTSASWSSIYSCWCGPPNGKFQRMRFSLWCSKGYRPKPSQLSSWTFHASFNSHRFRSAQTHHPKHASSPAQTALLDPGTGACTFQTDHTALGALLRSNHTFFQSPKLKLRESIRNQDQVRSFQFLIDS